jgi:DNA-binding IclR family transcriptional regulator
MRKQDRGRKLKTLERAINILGLIEREDGSDLSAVTDELGLAKSTAHGYLSTLNQHDYVHQQDGTYYIGTKLLTLGGQVRHRHPSYQLMIEKVEEVSDHTSERAQFVIEEAGRCIHLHVAKGTNGVEVNSRIGKRSYLHASAAGKSILAWSPKEKVDEVVEQWGLPALTENTITDRKRLDEELSQVRDRGFAQNIEESIGGLNAIGVPIRDGDDVVGAISVSGPSYRLADEVLNKEVPKYLLGVSNELELRILYKE